MDLRGGRHNVWDPFVALCRIRQTESGEARFILDCRRDSIGVPQDPLVEVSYDNKPLESPSVTTVKLTNNGYSDLDVFLPGAIRYMVSPNTNTRDSVMGILAGGADAATFDRDSGSISFKPAVIKRGNSVEGESYV